jgi:adenylylsulfate kinase-like enzyme
LYAKARRGEIKGLTGVDDPYEQPSSPDIVMQTIDRDADACAHQIERLLEGKGFI